MNKLNVSALFAAIMFLAACNNPTEKNEMSATDTTTKEIVAEKPKGLDTIEIYHYKGGEPYINTTYLKSASEAEKAMLAYYCYFFNTKCKDSKHCVLTDALGLGEQNSKQHRDLVLKYFSDDETVQLAKEGGRITPEGCTNMAWYEELKMVKKGSDLIVVRYNSAWKTKNQEGKGRGTDEYQIEPNHIKVIGRQHEDL